MKTFIIPVFLYRTSLISLDKEFVKEANKIIFDFIWKGKDKVKCSGLISDIEDVNNFDLSKVILWNYKFICIGDKSVYFRNLAEKGILRVGDLISNKNELIFKSELRVLHLSLLDTFRRSL